MAANDSDRRVVELTARISVLATERNVGQSRRGEDQQVLDLRFWDALDALWRNSDLDLKRKLPGPCIGNEVGPSVAGGLERPHQRFASVAVEKQEIARLDHVNKFDVLIRSEEFSGEAFLLSGG